MSKRIVLIVSKSGDYTAKLVSDWAYYYCLTGNKLFRHINADKETFRFTEISFTNGEINKHIQFNNEEYEYHLDDIQGIYFRSGALTYTNYTGLRSNTESMVNTYSRLANYFMAYEHNIKNHCLDSLKSLNLIGNDNGAFINKITVLNTAFLIGLKIPNTILTTKRAGLMSFNKKCSQIITKSLGLNLSFYNQNNETVYSQYTHEITKEDILTFPDEFPLTLFQEKIGKLFEIRTFYIHGSMYSCAMFTQNKKETQTDYRHYDRENPTRIVPFTLPEDIEQKIDGLMHKLNLVTGSLDIIYSVDNEYIFLEVNPSGQYIANSENCNFYLQKIVAQHLVL